jgi:prepilin-type N-terminal cleavage/methylation domain-containing protein
MKKLQIQKKYQRHKKAFTLVELIIVITILAILATIAFTSFSKYTISSRDTTRIATLTNVEK